MEDTGILVTKSCSPWRYFVCESSPFTSTPLQLHLTVSPCGRVGAKHGHYRLCRCLWATYQTLQAHHPWLIPPEPPYFPCEGKIEVKIEGFASPGCIGLTPVLAVPGKGNFGSSSDPTATRWNYLREVLHTAGWVGWCRYELIPSFATLTFPSEQDFYSNHRKQKRCDNPVSAFHGPFTLSSSARMSLDWTFQNRAVLLTIPGSSRVNKPRGLRARSKYAHLAWYSITEQRPSSILIPAWAKAV